MDLEDDGEEPSSKISKKTDSPMEEKLSVELKSKDDQIKMLQNTLQVNVYRLLLFSLYLSFFKGMQKQLLEAQKKSGMLPKFLRNQSKEESQKKPQTFGVIDLASDDEDEVKENNKSADRSLEKEAAERSEQRGQTKLKKPSENLNEVRTIMFISMFLHIHPGGAELKEISDYVKRIDGNSDLNEEEVEKILLKYNNCFVSESTSECNLVKWKIMNFWENKK